MAKKRNEEVIPIQEPEVVETAPVEAEVVVEKKPEPKPAKKKDIMKVYQSLYALKLHFMLFIGDKRMTIEFTGGYYNDANRVLGKFQTLNTELQNALESNPEFNKSYRLISTQEIEEMKPDIVVTERLKSKIVLAEITTCQGARDYLLKNFTLVPETLQNKTAILTVAEKLNIIFPKII